MGHGAVKLWLARHAAPSIAPGICYGRLDVAAGDAATQSAARALAAALPQGLPVRVSGLQRARQLAHALQALREDLQPTRDERLNEMDFGAWEGVPWQGIPKAAIDEWTRNFAEHRAGGVQDARTDFAGALTRRPADAPRRRLRCPPFRPRTSGHGAPSHFCDHTAASPPNAKKAAAVLGV